MITAKAESCGCMKFGNGHVSLCPKHSHEREADAASPNRDLTKGPVDFSVTIEHPTFRQVGGDHYKSMPIQPIEYIHKNGLDYMQGNVIKYITRHKSKNGRQDVEKALHYCQLILELQYGEES